MKKLLLILLICLPVLAFAKERKEKNNSDPKYLSGAITMVDGKITFTKEIQVPSLSQQDIFKKMLDWANNRFKPENDMQSRVVYTDEKKGDIAATAEEYIVFSSTALSLDRTRIYYQFLINAQDGVCTLNMTRIRYWYDEMRDGGEKYSAEEWISDKMALNKKKTKLAPICGKFRRETIDLKDELFQSASEALGLQATNAQTANGTPQIIPAVPLQPATPVTLAATGGELKEIAFSQLPGNLDEIASSGRITITANEEETDVKAENWGGFGKLFNKNVAYMIIDKSRIAVSAMMENSSDYKISFYMGGSTEPCVVIECKKSMAQKMSADELKSLNQSVDASKEYTMYIGEVTRTLMR